MPMQGYAHVMSIRRKKPSHDSAVLNGGHEPGGDHADRSRSYYGRPIFPTETQSESNIQVLTSNPAGSNRCLSYPNSSGSGSYSSSIQTPARTVSDQYTPPSYTSYTSSNGPNAFAEYAEPHNFDDSSGYYGQEARSEADQAPSTNRNLPRESVLSRSMNRRRPTDPNLQGQQAQGSRRKETRDSHAVDDQTSPRCVEMLDERRQTRGYPGSPMPDDWVASRDYPDQGVAGSDWDFPQDAQTIAPHRRSVQQIVSPRDSRYTDEPEQLWDGEGGGWHGHEVGDAVTSEPRDEGNYPDVYYEGGEVEEYEDSGQKNLRGSYASDEDDCSADSTRAFKWEVYVRWDDPRSRHASFITETCTLQLDSGCEKSNWVTEKVVKRLRAQTHPVSHCGNYVGFGGQPMFSKEQTSLAFQHKNGGDPQRAIFFVLAGEDLPFELVLGATDCLRFGYLTKPEPPAFCGGLVAPKLSEVDKKEQAEQDALQAKRKKDQKEKHKQLMRKKASSGMQDQNATSSRRRPTH